MKIVSVRPVRAGQFLYARVETACGLVGWGESGAWGHLEASAAALSKFAEYLVGEDPRRIELHWNVMQRFAHFRGHAVNGAVSAVDIALWDVLGQSLGAPVHALLGGAIRREARVYGHAYAPTADAIVADVRRLREAGFGAVGHINPFLDADEGDPAYGEAQVAKLRGAADVVRRFREAAGEGMDVLLECHRRLDPAEALRFARLVEAHEPMWVEDPLRPEYVAATGDLARRSPVPVATGERFTSFVEFEQQLAAGPVAYARVSTCVVGGITGARRAAAVAEAHGARLAPHNPLSPVGLVACLHVAACAPNFAILEYPTGFAGLRMLSTGDLLGAHLVDAPPRAEGGYVAVPDRPGLGIAVDEAAALAEPPVTRPVSMRRHRDGSPVDQ